MPGSHPERAQLPVPSPRRESFLRPTRNLAGLGLALIVAAAALLAFGAGLATTEPAAIEAQRAEVARIQSELESINTQVAVAAEAYNGARYELGQVNARIRENGDRLTATGRDLESSREKLADRLRRLYATPEPSLIEVLVSTGSIAGAADQLDMLDRVGRQDAAVVGGLREQKARLKELRAQLVEDRQAAEQAVTTREQQKRKVESLLSQRRAVLDSASAELRQLLRAEEERKRREAAAQAEAARQRQAAAAAAAQSSSAGSSSSSGSAASGSASSGSPSSGAAAPAAASEPAAPSAPLPSGSGNAAAAQYAMSQLGTPYVWGGASPGSGFDCSGLASWAYAQIGKSVPHYTVAIYNAFPRVPSGQLQVGDLVFWRGLGHMGIYIGGGQYVHAPQTGDVVKVSSMSSRSDYVGAVRP